MLLEAVCGVGANDASLLAALVAGGGAASQSQI
jgi:hypothetical protein